MTRALRLNDGCPAEHDQANFCSQSGRNVISVIGQTSHQCQPVLLFGARWQATPGLAQEHSHYCTPLCAYAQRIMATMAMPVMSAAAIAPRSSVRAKVAIRGVRVVGARPIVARPAAVRVAASATVEKTDDVALGQVRIARLPYFGPVRSRRLTRTRRATPPRGWRRSNSVRERLTQSITQRNARRAGAGRGSAARFR